MASRLDEIFHGVQVRVTSDAPTHNFMVRLEDEARIKQEVKELFTILVSKHVTSPKDAAKLRREIGKL